MTDDDGSPSQPVGLTDVWWQQSWSRSSEDCCRSLDTGSATWTRRSSCLHIKRTRIST